MDIMGYIKDEKFGFSALCFNYEKHTDNSHFKLLSNGYELILHNTYDSLDEAYQVLQSGIINDTNNEIHAYKEDCRICGNFILTTKVTGRYYSMHHDKVILFNGRACDQCLNDFESVKFEGKMQSPQAIENILIKRNFKNFN
jgi:hypothetical protein